MPYLRRAGGRLVGRIDFFECRPKYRRIFARTERLGGCTDISSTRGPG